ncbi:MAG: hypothetical protein NTZ20_04995 [Candidatus Levybacteria bacterium]|nr:hypothetical protein [Candidatus Levybacteria bacterium]
MYKSIQTHSIMDAFHIGDKFSKFSLRKYEENDGSISKLIHMMNLDCVKLIGKTHTKRLIAGGLIHYENEQEQRLYEMLVDAKLNHY